MYNLHKIQEKCKYREVHFVLLSYSKNIQILCFFQVGVPMVDLRF